MKRTRWPIATALLLVAIAAGAQELDRVDPEDVGLSTERLERLDNYIRAQIDDNQVAGAVVLIQRRGSIAYHRAYGQSDVETGRVIRPDDIFRIASMTKAITSAAVMVLFEEGHFLLDDPVGDYLPEFDRDMNVVVEAADRYEYVAAKQPITIRHLLTHTSGLSYRFMGLEPLSEMYTNAGISDGLAGENLSLQAFSSQLAEMPLAHHPGEAWTYGLNSDVLGRLIEVVSGKPLAEFFAERLFEPLEMKDTHFEIPEEKLARVPRVHRRTSQGFLQRLPDGTIDDGPVRFSVNYPYDGKLGLLSGGAGLSSTAADYGRFLQMILNGGELGGVRVLGRKTVELMTSNQTSHIDNPAFGASGFTLGFAYDAGPAVSGNIGSPGNLSWGGFFNTLFWIDPEEQLTAILMTQHYPYGIELLGRFPVLVYQAVID